MAFVIHAYFYRNNTRLKVLQKLVMLYNIHRNLQKRNKMHIIALIFTGQIMAYSWIKLNVNIFKKTYLVIVNLVIPF
jgi:hypothetical protein